jgi:hypothetical protein
LLAFEEPKKCPFRDLLHPTHRQKVNIYFYWSNLK